MLAKARAILISELALAKHEDEEAASDRLDKIMEEAQIEYDRVNNK